MKKKLIVILIAMLALTFTACGDQGNTEEVAGTDSDATIETDTSSDDMIDGTFGELTYQIKNYRTDDDQDDNDIEYYLDEGGKIQIASNDKLIGLYKSPSDLLLSDNKQEAGDVDAEDGEKFEIIAEEEWSNDNGITGYKSITKNVDEDETEMEYKVAIFTDKTCYILSLETAGENKAAEEVFNKFLETIALK